VIGVLVSGAGTNLQALIDAALPISAVAGNVPGAAALGRAERAGIPTAVFVLEDYPTREARDTAIADWLDDHGVSLVVCAGYMQLLTPGFLRRFPESVINVHPSLLPAFPGVRAVADALAAGVTETGVTVHFVDEGIDSGPIIAQERVSILPGDSEATLLERLHEVEHRLLPRAVQDILAARLNSPL
jgi:phosphoribosylglycinamide formyltransferase-1